MSKNIIIYIAILCSLFACKSHKSVVTHSPDDAPAMACKTRIEFGSGGGFTNVIKSYTLYDDGTLLEGDRVLRQMPADSIRTALRLADSIKSSYIAPGNTYQFVNIYHSTDSVFCSWQYGDKKIKPEITTLYNTLKELL